MQKKQAFTDIEERDIESSKNNYIMKNIFFILFVLSFHFAHAITGTRNDSILFYLSIIAFMTFILAVLYSISFVRKIIKEHKDKKINLPADKIESENNN